MATDPRGRSPGAGSAPCTECKAGAERYVFDDYTCSLPTVYFVDICNACTLRCPYCPTGRRDRSFRHGVIPLDRFKVVLEKIKDHAKVINLHNWGEPFLNRDILEIASLVHRCGIRVHTDSNFNFKALNPSGAERIIEAGFTSLHASIDGTSQETYQQYRIGGDFGLAMHNLRMLAEAKDRLRAPAELAWKFVVFKANEHEIPRAVEMAEQIGVPLVFQLLSTDGDVRWNSSLHERAVELDDGEPLVVTVNGTDHQVVWRNYAPMARARAREAGGECAPHPRAVPTTPRKRDFPLPVNRIGLDPLLPWCCAHPFEALYVNSDGNVSPCCTAYGDAMALGNLFEQSLEEVWNGPEITRCRQYLLEYGSQEQTRAVCETRPCFMKATSTGKP